MTSKEKTWSLGENSRLPLAVNVTVRLNVSNDCSMEGRGEGDERRVYPLD